MPMTIYLVHLGIQISLKVICSIRFHDITNS